MYRTRIDASFKPYTVIDVLQKVYHRSFEDDLLSAVTLHPEWFQPSVDGWKLARAWIRSLRIIRPESIFFQKTSDFQVDIAIEARICMEQARCGNALLKRRCNADKTLRLRYSFDLRPCKMSCSYLGAVMNEKDSLRERDFMGISVDKYLISVLKPGDYSMIARYIFSRFLPEQLNSVLPFEPEKWIRPMGLKVKRGVFPENGALGEYFFSFGTAETIDEETGEIVQSDINPGTILLNRDIPYHGGIRNSTLAHEASHSFLGRFFFLLQKTHGHDYCSYMCKRYDHEEREKWTPVDIMEMQANRLPGYLMGYRRGKDGTPEVVEAEADVVRTIFRHFLEGATPAMISRELNLSGIPCPSRKSLLSENEAEIAKARKKTSRWGTSTVENILANEKYKGDAILQKTYCTDYLLKTFVVNDGSVVPKYYAQNSHPAIVSPEVFDLAQQELAWRRSLNGRYSGRSCFASRVVCGDCGAFYGSKVWHSTDEYRRTIWRCNNKYAGETKCATPHVTQEALEKAFVQVIQQMLSQKDRILTAYREALDEAFDTTELDKAATRLQDQALGMAERVRQLVEENARVQIDQDEFKKDYEALLAEHARLSEKIRTIAEQKKDKAERQRRIELFLHMLEEQKECAEFESGCSWRWWTR